MVEFFCQESPGQLLRAGATAPLCRIQFMCMVVGHSLLIIYCVLFIIEYVVDYAVCMIYDSLFRVHCSKFGDWVRDEG